MNSGGSSWACRRLPKRDGGRKWKPAPCAKTCSIGPPAAKQEEVHWRGRARELRTEIATLDRQINYVQARLTEINESSRFSGSWTNEYPIWPDWRSGRNRRSGRRDRPQTNPPIFGPQYPNGYPQGRYPNGYPQRTDTHGYPKVRYPGYPGQYPGYPGQYPGYPGQYPGYPGGNYPPYGYLARTVIRILMDIRRHLSRPTRRSNIRTSRAAWMIC